MQRTLSKNFREIVVSLKFKKIFLIILTAIWVAYPCISVSSTTDNTTPKKNISSHHSKKNKHSTKKPTKKSHKCKHHHNQKLHHKTTHVTSTTDESNDIATVSTDTNPMSVAPASHPISPASSTQPAITRTIAETSSLSTTAHPFFCAIL